MGARDYVTIGMTAEKTVTVTSEMTVGHFVAHMPQVYATPMMILHMEMASGSAIASHLLSRHIATPFPWAVLGSFPSALALFLKHLFLGPGTIVRFMEISRTRRAATAGARAA